MTNTQKLNIYNLKFEDFCLLVNPRYLGCKQTEKGFYDVQALLKRRKWSELVGCRYSWYFIEGLVKLKIKNEFVAEIINEIECLEESIVYTTLTKTQTQFKYEPLKGLWHKHFHLGNLKNIKIMYLDPLIKDKKSKKIMQECRALEKTKKKGDSDLSLVWSVLKKHTIDDYELRGERGQLTGEWIVYHEFLGEKYYLGLWKHDDREAEIANQINQIFKVEFPEFHHQLSVFSY